MCQKCVKSHKNICQKCVKSHIFGTYSLMIENEGNIIPIEIKSGSRISGRSLAEYRKKYQPNLLVRFSLNNLQYNDGMLSIPLPLADWLKKIFSFVKN